MIVCDSSPGRLRHIPRSRIPGSSTPVLLPGGSHGQGSLAGYGPQGCKELDTTKLTEYTHMYVLILFLTFLRKDHTIFHSSYITLHSTNSSDFSVSLSALVIFCLFFDSDHPNGSEMIFCCALICISLMVVILSIFSHAVDHLYIFFGEKSIQVLCPFLNWVIHVFICY